MPLFFNLSTQGWIKPLKYKLFFLKFKQTVLKSVQFEMLNKIQKNDHKKYCFNFGYIRLVIITQHLILKYSNRKRSKIMVVDRAPERTIWSDALKSNMPLSSYLIRKRLR